MEVVRLLESDGTLAAFDADWKSQCAEVGEDCDSFGQGTVPMIRRFASTDNNKEWAVAVVDGDRFLAAACFIRAIQKPFSGPVLRIRELTVCPLLDYGNLDEIFYGNTLVSVLQGAIKLSERNLQAQHIKLHLRSPADAEFFREFREKLDSAGAFASTAAHGAWLIFSKAPPLQLVK